MPPVTAQDVLEGGGIGAIGRWAVLVAVDGRWHALVTELRAQAADVTGADPQEFCCCAHLQATRIQTDQDLDLALLLVVQGYYPHTPEYADIFPEQ